MKDWFILPKKWRHLVFVLKDMEGRLSVRLMHKIERLNRRMVILEAKRGPA
jgi:hypothetical protein